jgi:prepilin-type N-terminal cleavage/methylation domain-containing protein
MKEFERKTKNRGLALIEMLVAVIIFSIIIGAISGLFISAIRSQRSVLATQELLDQTSYVLEYMGRALRMAKKDSSGTCILAGNNYENVGGISSVRFINYDDKCQEFFSENNQLKEKKSSDGTETNLPPSGTPITSLKLQVNSLKFNLSGQYGSDMFQSRVTIFLEIESKRTAESPPKIQIQTSISQRDIEITTPKTYFLPCAGDCGLAQCESAGAGGCDFANPSLTCSRGTEACSIPTPPYCPGALPHSTGGGTCSCTTVRSGCLECDSGKCVNFTICGEAGNCTYECDPQYAWDGTNCVPAP